MSNVPATDNSAARAVRLLTERGLTVGTAESLTGGLIAGALTAVPGASACVAGGFMTYTDELKNRLLGVPRALLAEMGAVSEPVARAMAQGARNRLATDFALSATGYAGPGDNAGLVWLAIADGRSVVARKFLFAGDRAAVRAASASEALRLLIRQIEASLG